MRLKSRLCTCSCCSCCLFWPDLKAVVLAVDFHIKVLLRLGIQLAGHQWHPVEPDFHCWCSTTLLDFELFVMAKHPQLEVRAASLKRLQHIWVWAKQLQAALAWLAAYVHYDHLCVLTAGMEESKPFEWTTLSSDDNLTKVVQFHRCSGLLERGGFQFLPPSRRWSPQGFGTSTGWHLHLAPITEGKVCQGSFWCFYWCPTQVDSLQSRVNDTGLGTKWLQMHYLSPLTSS